MPQKNMILLVCFQIDSWNLSVAYLDCGHWVLISIGTKNKTGVLISIRV